jgi:hypothetical protein
LSVKRQHQQASTETLLVQNCLDLANLPAEATEAKLAWAAERIRPRPLLEDMESFVEGGGSVGRALRERLIRLLRSWTRHSRAARKPVKGELQGVVTQAVVRVSGTGTRTVEIQYKPQDDDAVERLLTSFLHDPNLDIGERLRTCELPGCGWFFLSWSKPGGGPRPKYCQPEHQQEADRRDAVNRMARKRRKEARRNK